MSKLKSVKEEAPEITEFEDSHTTKMIAVRHLSVLWATAQRGFNEKWAKELAETFDPDLFDVVVVTRAGNDGMHHVIDGQHRVAMMRMLYGDDEQVPCRVLNINDPARAAAVFVQINRGRLKVSAVETFLCMVKAGPEHGGEVETAIDRIITDIGYRVATYKANGTISATAALLYLYKKHGGHSLRETLQTIKAIWGDDQNALDGRIIRGMGAFITSHRETIDFKRLRERINRELTPGKLIGLGKYHSESAKCNIEAGIKYQLVRVYNDGLRTGKLAVTA